MYSWVHLPSHTAISTGFRHTQHKAQSVSSYICRKRALLPKLWLTSFKVVTVKLPSASWESLTGFQLHLTTSSLLPWGYCERWAQIRSSPSPDSFFMCWALSPWCWAETAAGECIVLLASLKGIIMAFLSPEDDEFFFKNIHYKTLFSHPVYGSVGESSCEIHKTVTMS